jgi:hypothetical protein
MQRSAAFLPIALALGVLASGLARADARKEGPIEIEKCQTISQAGSYKLVTNLTVAEGANDCLLITANDVSIDLAGFLIRGGGPSRVGVGGFPPEGPLPSGVTVRNGSIVGFGFGVNVGGDSLIEGLHVIGGCGRPCTTGISAGGIVKNNTVSEVSVGGISATGVITGNVVIGSGEDAFGIGVGSTVIGNTATEAFRAGFRVDCPSNVTDNTAVNNGSNSSTPNLVLNGTGCNNTNNVAP